MILGSRMKHGSAKTLEAWYVGVIGSMKLANSEDNDPGMDDSSGHGYNLPAIVVLPEVCLRNFSVKVKVRS